jgi:hypothetical protein
MGDQPSRRALTALTRLLEAAPYRPASPYCRITSSTLRLCILPPNPSERLINSAISFQRPDKRLGSRRSSGEAQGVFLLAFREQAISQVAPWEQLAA